MAMKTTWMGFEITTMRTRNERKELLTIQSSLPIVLTNLVLKF